MAQQDSDGLIASLNDYIDAITDVPNIDQDLYTAEDPDLQLFKRGMDVAKNVANKLGGRESSEQRPELRLIESVLKTHHEVLYNLQFLNPYLKKSPAYQYAELQRRYRALSDTEKDQFLIKVTEKLHAMKNQILYKNQDT